MALTQVSTGGVKDGTLLNADVNAAASIAGTKVSPNFGSQNIVTTGGLTVDTSTLHVDTSNNRVGIGTTSPDGTLDVRGTIFVNGDGTGGRIFASSGNLSLSDGNGRQVLRIDDPGAGNSHAHIFDSNGRLGIGTTSPGSLLTLNDATNPAIQFQDSGTKVASINAEGTATNIASFEGKSLVFATSTGSSFNGRMTIDTDGRVKVNTANLLDAFQIDYGGGFNLVFDGAGTITQFRGNGSNGGLTIDTALTSGSWGSADAGFLSFKPKGTQTFLLTTSGAAVYGDLSISSSLAKISMTDTDGGDLFQIRNDAGTFIIRNGTDSKSVLTIDGACVTSILNATPPATGVSTLHVSNGGSATTLGTAATFRVSNDGGNSNYSVFEAESGSGYIRLANDGVFHVDSHLLMRAGHVLRRSEHDTGHLEGGYNNIGANDAKTSPIFTIGSNYNPNAESLSNMYGIGYSHGNASFTPSGAGWGMYVAADGDARIYLDGSNGNMHLFHGTQKGGTIFFSNGGWTGETTNGKIQTHGNHMYFQTAGSSWFFRKNNGVTAATIANNGAYTASDLTFKKDIVTISNSVDTIKKLTGRSFTWKEENIKSFGVIAQEVETVLPELVTTTEEPEGSEVEAKKMVNYAAFAGHFIEAIKELATKVEALETEVATLKAS